jgi:glycine cleavage system H protein
MTIPADLRYTAEHEWVAIDGPVATVGITDYAQNSLGDVVYVSVPAPGARVSAGEPCGEVESTKSVSDIYDDPGLVNSDPYGAGWLIRVRLDDEDAEPGGLLTADEYAELAKEAE